MADMSFRPFPRDRRLETATLILAFIASCLAFSSCAAPAGKVALPIVFPEHPDLYRLPEVVPSSLPATASSGCAGNIAGRRIAARAPSSANSEALGRYYSNLSSWDEASIDDLLVALRAIDAPEGINVEELAVTASGLERDPFGN